MAGRSILDEVMSQTRSLARSASASDKQRLDEYFASVRNAEKDSPRPRRGSTGRSQRLTTISRQISMTKRISSAEPAC
jgi:ABC-type polar amino acid transport system ATPase subunit